MNYGHLNTAPCCREVAKYFFIYIISYLLLEQIFHWKLSETATPQPQSATSHFRECASGQKVLDCKEFDEIIVLRENISLITERTSFWNINICRLHASIVYLRHRRSRQQGQERLLRHKLQPQQQRGQPQVLHLRHWGSDPVRGKRDPQDPAERVVQRGGHPILRDGGAGRVPPVLQEHPQAVLLHRHDHHAHHQLPPLMLHSRHLPLLWDCRPHAPHR